MPIVKPELNDTGISVVIPTYNHARYVADAIDSVLQQTLAASEVIVVDDGSTDDTARVVSRYGDRVRYVYQENRGLSAARNTGIKAARFPWVAFLDADDWWLPIKLERQVTALRNSPGARFVYGSVSRRFEDGTTTTGTAIPPDRVWPAIRYRNSIDGGGSVVLARRDDILAAGGFDERLKACEDWDLWIRLCRRIPLAVVDEPTVMIRVLNQSMSADHERMLRNLDLILETTLLDGLSGLNRTLWRRRILAAQLQSAHIAAREAKSPAALSLISRSLVQWPWPWFLPLRWVNLVKAIVASP